MIVCDPYRFGGGGGVPFSAKAWQFDPAGSEYITASNGTGSTLMASDWTLSVWALVDTGPTRTILANSTTTVQYNFGNFFVNWSNPDITQAGFSGATWYHILIDYDDATFTSNLYVNNVFQTSNVGLASRSTGIHNIGEVVSGTSRLWDGKIREVAIFNEKVGATKRTNDIWNGGTPKDLRGLSNLWSYHAAWNSADGANGIVDMGVSGNDLEFVNMTAAANIVTP